MDKRHIACKLEDERFNEINFIIIRHFKGTCEYYHTKNVKHVQYILDHKHSNTTDVYVRIVESWVVRPDRWVSEVAHMPEEALELIEAGFEYVGCILGHEMFRKPKRIRKC